MRLRRQQLRLRPHRFGRLIRSTRPISARRRPCRRPNMHRHNHRHPWHDVRLSCLNFAGDRIGAMPAVTCAAIKSTVSARSRPAAAKAPPPQQCKIVHHRQNAGPWPRCALHLMLSLRCWIGGPKTRSVAISVQTSASPMVARHYALTARAAGHTQRGLKPLSGRNPESSPCKSRPTMGCRSHHEMLSRPCLSALKALWWGRSGAMRWAMPQWRSARDNVLMRRSVNPLVVHGGGPMINRC